MLTLPRVIRQIVCHLHLLPLPSLTTPISAVRNTILVSSPTVRTITESRPNRSPSPFPPRPKSAWIGWFPLLFYTSVYIGEIHIRSSSPSLSTKQLQLLEAEATRLGTRALLYHSVLALLANFVLPYFVTESAGRVGNTQKGMGRIQVHLASLWAASHFIFALCMVATMSVSLAPSFYAFFFLNVELTSCILVGCVFIGRFVSSVGSATLVVSITGFSWAVSQWAPYSLVCPFPLLPS